MVRSNSVEVEDNTTHTCGVIDIFTVHLTSLKN
jgi:hypothetical protein